MHAVRFARVAAFARRARALARTVAPAVPAGPRAAWPRAGAGIELDRRNPALGNALQPDGCAQHDEILIERLDASSQTDAVHEIDFDALALFARCVHEVVLRMGFCGIRHCTDDSRSCPRLVSEARWLRAKFVAGGDFNPC